MLTPEELATILDGEGTIGDCIQPSGEYPYPRVSLGMTDPKYPNELAAQFGGKVHLRKAKNPKHKDLYRIDYCGRSCEKLLMYALPHLRIKKGQAEILLVMISTFAKNGGNREFERVSAQDQLLRWKLHDILRELNRRGAKRQVDEVLTEMEVENASS